MSEKKKHVKITFDDILETIIAAGSQKTWTHVLQIPKHLKQDTIQMAKDAGSYSYPLKLYGYHIVWQGDAIDVIDMDNFKAPVWLWRT